MHILAVDPGKASGIALISLNLGEEPKIIMSGEYQMKESLSQYVRH